MTATCSTPSLTAFVTWASYHSTRAASPARATDQGFFAEGQCRTLQTNAAHGGETIVRASGSESTPISVKSDRSANTPCAVLDVFPTTVKIARSGALVCAAAYGRWSLMVMGPVTAPTVGASA